MLLFQVFETFDISNLSVGMPLSFRELWCDSQYQFFGQIERARSEGLDEVVHLLKSKGIEREDLVYKLA